MKKVYHSIAIAAIAAFAVIFAQDAFGQHNVGQGRGAIHKNKKGVDWDQTNNQGPIHQRHQWNKNKARFRGHRKGHHHRNPGAYQDLAFRFWGQPYRVGRVYVHQERFYAIRQGIFYTKRHGRWVSVEAPHGLRVDFIPRGAQMIYSRRGILHENRGTFYQELRGQGAVVVASPHRSKRSYKNW